jgi:hypothetical protein
MMKALARFAVPIAAAIGLAMAAAPSAGASPAAVTSHTVAIRTSFTNVSPCNGRTFTTHGIGIATIEVNGSEVRVTVDDDEAGGYYVFSEFAEDYFDGPSSSYTFPATILLFNESVPSQSFYEKANVTVSTTGGDVPTGFHSVVLSSSCGLELNF